jgi:hypothetical protein
MSRAGFAGCLGQSLQDSPADLHTFGALLIQNGATLKRDPSQLPEDRECLIFVQAPDLIGGGAWTRTTDLRIMRPSL